MKLITFLSLIVFNTLQVCMDFFILFGNYIVPGKRQNPSKRVFFYFSRWTLSCVIACWPCISYRDSKGPITRLYAYIDMCCVTVSVKCVRAAHSNKSRIQKYCESSTASDTLSSRQKKHSRYLTL